MPGWFSRFISYLGLSKPLLDASYFQQILSKVTQQRELNGYVERFIQKIVPRTEDQFILFGDLGGAFHSFVRDIRSTH